MKQLKETKTTYSGLFAIAVIAFGMIGSATGVFGQKQVRFVEPMNQVVHFKKTAPVNTIKPASQRFDTAIRAGNAAVNKRIALRAAQNHRMILRAGDAALEHRKLIAQARQAAKSGKIMRRAAIAGTGIGLVFVGGMWIAESLIGDSPEDVAIDTIASIFQGKRLDLVANDVGRRLDPARVTRNVGRNLDQTGKDISNAVNLIGRELGKIRL